MATLTLACQAMATRFELVLHGEDPVFLRAAGEEALAEIERLEDQLSLYRPSSEISHVNARAAHEPVRVTPSLFGLLQTAANLHQASSGTFDITIAPLVRCWGFMGGSGQLPERGALAEARERVGMDLVQLDAEKQSVRFSREGVMLDLGAIGKGYAVEQAANVLRELEVSSALLHGGTSTIYALGRPPEAEFWQVAIPHPRPVPNVHPLALVSLRDEALSVSDISGKSFVADGKTFGHVIDPRSGEPARNGLLAAVVLPSATETDALSTALLTLGPTGTQKMAAIRPGVRALLAFESDGRFEVESIGMSVQPPGKSKVDGEQRCR